jgi:uncharacterized protein (DUF1015 family)
MEVIPFQGIRYNQRIIGDLAKVICPPYDVIAPDQQELYYERSDYNAIRLEFPELTHDRYEKAAIVFRQWLKQGILRRDSTSSFYLHDHAFEYSGKKMTRRGLIACVKLEPWGNGIYPHEETSPKAKGDRLLLMRACRANFSPLFSLYRDTERKVGEILSYEAQKKPLISLSFREARSIFPDSHEAHMLWAISDPDTKLQLSRLFSSQPLYIADGHHRYETALTYQQERTQCQSGGCKLTTEAFSYVMMELVEFSDPGLVILPLHRLVRGIESSLLTGLREKLRNFFAIESIPLEGEDWHLPNDSYLGILGLQHGSLVVLKKRQDTSLEAMMPDNRSQGYRKIGVSILDHVILDKMLGLISKEDIAYVVDWKKASQQIKEGKYQLAFLLNPPQPEMVKAVADAQDRMPRKSTYFYPKVPAGLVINPLD